VLPAESPVNGCYSGRDAGLVPKGTSDSRHTIKFEARRIGHERSGREERAASTACSGLHTHSTGAIVERKAIKEAAKAVKDI